VQREQIKWRLQEGVTVSVLAREFATSRQTIMLARYIEPELRRRAGDLPSSAAR
jgi:hypothetical protein